MRLLFVIPRNKSLFGDKGMTAHPHIGVAYLCSYLKQHNVDIEIFDEGLEGGLKRLDYIIDDFKPELIGVTIFSYCYSYAYNLIKRIREKTNTPIVVGGPHICAIGKKILEDA